MTEWADSIPVDNEEKRVARRALLERAEAYSERLLTLNEHVEDKKVAMAEVKKQLGNDAFKKEQYVQAVALYTEAIAADSSNPSYYTNRALAYQRLNKLEDALIDGKMAIELDVDLLKGELFPIHELHKLLQCSLSHSLSAGYIIVLKCLLKLAQSDPSLLAEVEKTVNSVPSAHEERAELLEQRALAAAAAKDAGNQSLKDGELDEAVAFYSMAIRFDGTNHIYYSNRSAAYQAKKMWRDAASDAEHVVKLNPQFPKGYLHWARSLVQQQKFKDALGAVEKAKAELAKCGELAGVQTQLAEISAQIAAGLSPAGRRMPDASDATRAEAFKKKGNESYKEGEYQDAVRFYSQVRALKAPAVNVLSGLVLSCLSLTGRLALFCTLPPSLGHCGAAERRIVLRQPRGVVDHAQGVQARCGGLR